MSYAIVILSKTLPKLAGCIGAIRSSGCRAPIIVVDDGLGLNDPASLAAGIAESRGPLFEEWRPMIVLPGEKPFVFARNANIGIRYAQGLNIPGPGAADVILLNDDARVEMARPGLEGMCPFDLLSSVARANPQLGVVSALIDGMAAAPDQCVDADRLRAGWQNPFASAQVQHHMLAFVCVYIRRVVLELVGLLDERFIGYGWEDDDYCRRLQTYGLQLGVAYGCVVEHGSVPSSYRGSAAGGADLLAQNREIFAAKWKR